MLLREGHGHPIFNRNAIGKVRPIQFTVGTL
jgi:hypothetical protein